MFGRLTHLMKVGFRKGFVEVITLLITLIISILIGIVVIGQLQNVISGFDLIPTAHTLIENLFGQVWVAMGFYASIVPILITAGIVIKVLTSINKEKRK